MLGLHNIFLIAPPPPASFQFQQHNQQQQQPPLFSSNDHQITNNQQESWTPLKLYAQDSCFARKDGFNEAEDKDNNNNNSNSSSNRACRDCGNRAKKECEYSRCRTCCKSKGYACATHVKSTWVPAARRRERLADDDAGGGGGADGVSSAGVAAGKRPRDNNGSTTSNSFSTSNNNAAAFFNFDTCSSYQDASFKQSLPGHVRAPAVFRCIRVTAVGGSKAEIAYQAVVNIKGHVFKGFLYHHGIDQNNELPCISKMNVAGRNRDSTSPVVDLPNAYAAFVSQRLVGGNE